MDEQRAISFWQNPRVQVIVQHALGSSGIIGDGFLKLCHYFGWPAPDLGMMSEYTMAAIPLICSAAFSWWNSHPNNVAARLIRQINGDAVSEETKAAVVAAVVQNGETK